MITQKQANTVNKVLDVLAKWDTKTVPMPKHIFQKQIKRIRKLQNTKYFWPLTFMIAEYALRWQDYKIPD